MGYALAVETPVPTKRPGGLMDVADVVTTSDPHVALGVSYPNNGLCGTAGLTPDACFIDNDGNGDASKSFNGFDDVVSFGISIYYGIECWLDGSEDYANGARTGLDFLGAVPLESQFLERYLVPETDHTDGSTTTPLNAATGLGLIEQRLAKVSGGVGLIHVPLGGLDILSRYNLIYPNLDGSYTTAAGNLVVGGAGYGDDWLANPTRFTIFATPMVHLYPGPVTTSVAQDRPHNTGQALAEQTIQITVDCGGVFAAVVSAN